MIKPTVGRVVLFFVDTKTGSSDFTNPPAGQPLPALICCVHSDSCINLVVFDANGVSHSRTSVRLIQEGEPIPETGYYATWMPYQIGQSKKDTAPTETAKFATPVSEVEMEEKIVAAGLTAPRITSSDIDAMVARVTYHLHRQPGTTTTLVNAFLDGDYYLATGFSACVSAENFDAQVGAEIAINDANEKVRDLLWKMEGYALRKQLRATSGQVNG